MVVEAVSVPRWETGDGWVRAICEPDGYCADGHRCGKLDLGIVREQTPEPDCLEVPDR